MRFLHTADLQLGMTRRFLPAEAQARFAQARLDAIRTIGDLARREGADFVIVAGDVFESNHLDRHTVPRAFDAMAAIDVPVVLLPGNHDPLDAASVYRSPAFVAGCPAHVTVLDSTTPFEVVPGVEIVGAPWASKRPLEDLAAAAIETLAPCRPGVRRVLAAHGAVDETFPERRDPSVIKLAALEAGLASGAVHYVALGDRHSATPVGATGRVWYSGAPEPTDFDETAPGQVLVVELDDDVTVRAEKVAGWEFARHDARLDRAADIDSLFTWLDDHAHPCRTIVRLGLVGTLSLSERARLDAGLDERSPRFAALDVWAAATDLVSVPDAHDGDELGLMGFAARAVTELQGRAEASREQAASDALSLLYRLTRDAA